MKKKLLVVLVVLSALAVYGIALRPRDVARLLPSGVPVPGSVSYDVKLIPNPRTPAEKIVNGAKNEVLRGVHYDAAYLRIPYPKGDVPSDQGACTDVVIRALRNAGYDLQKLIHEDMSRNFRLYPRNYSLNRPDSNIDHRRIPNQMTFMRRFGKELPLSTARDDLKTWKQGDIIYWKFDNGLQHCGIISNDKSHDGTPLVIHNIGITRQEDCMNRWQIIGHYRYPIGRT